MPTPNPTSRREYKGAAAATTLSVGIAAGDTSFTLVAANNWPTGAVGNFIVTIDRGQTNEERILCSAQASKVVTVAGSGRGFDGTTAASHASGATVECTLSAFDADEWNQHTNATAGVHGVNGSVVGTSDTQTLTNKTLTGATLDAASTIGGVSGTSLAADRAAWTTYTPTLTNITIGNGTMYAAYRQVGKFIAVRFSITFGTTTTIAAIASFSLPAAALNGPDQSLGGSGTHSGTLAVINGRIPSNTSTCQLAAASAAINATTPWTWAATDSFGLSGVYEAA